MYNQIQKNFITFEVCFLNIFRTGKTEKVNNIAEFNCIIINESNEKKDTTNIYFKQNNHN